MKSSVQAVQRFVSGDLDLYYLGRNTWLTSNFCDISNILLSLALADKITHLLNEFH